ncbi:hypothetical protein IWQ60_010876 [Tieghemiomyces parasiticus]|uniref:Uncharacterized protein n=1 Tax=Tieghemiomyces parasiticus TaxID=78921 RepID=A0A9W7ZJY1_9FUNG|nr:hypothetical protein IWQ60_010876 [Tieghemiomyces parasiticus]
MKDTTRKTLNDYLSPVLNANGRQNMQCAELYRLDTAAAVIRRSLTAYRQQRGITNVREAPMPPTFCKGTLYDTRYFHFARHDNEVHFYVRTNTDDLTPEQRAALTPVSSDKVPFSSFGPTGAEDTIPEDEFTTGKVTLSEPALRILRKF